MVQTCTQGYTETWIPWLFPPAQQTPKYYFDDDDVVL